VARSLQALRATGAAAVARSLSEQPLPSPAMRVRLDEEALKAIADLTRAEYQSLRSKLVMEKKETEITRCSPPSLP
jgi:hypothetical protein